MTILLLAGAMLIAASSSAADIQPLRPDGIGKLKIGQSIANISRLLEEEIPLPKDSSDQFCFYFQTQQFPRVRFMIEEGVLHRIDVTEAGQLTSDGIKIGDPTSKVISRYGKRLIIEAHHYAGPKEKYLTLKAPGGQLATRFETADGRVAAIYSGDFAQVRYVEGCL